MNGFGQRIRHPLSLFLPKETWENANTTCSVSCPAVPPLEKAHPNQRRAKCNDRKESQPEDYSADPECKAPEPQQVSRPPGEYSRFHRCLSKQEKAYCQEQMGGPVDEIELVVAEERKAVVH